MMRALVTGVLLAGLMGEIAAPVHAQTHVTKVYHGRSRSRRNRRVRNTAIGAGGGAAAGAILGGGRGAGAGAVIGGTVGALRRTRRR